MAKKARISFIPKVIEKDLKRILNLGSGRKVNRSFSYPFGVELFANIDYNDPKYKMTQVEFLNRVILCNTGDLKVTEV